MTARWVEAWTDGRVAVRPWQTFPKRMEEAGLTAEDTEREAWLITPQGEALGGAAAVNGALRYVWWARPLTWLYAVPGLRQVEDAVYRWVARNRGHFPGVTPACEGDADCEGEGI